MSTRQYSDAEILNTDATLIRLDDDHEFLSELYTMFLEDGPERYSTLKNALENDDLAAASKAAHSLKGMCGTIHATALMNAALEAEVAGKKGDTAQINELAKEINVLLDLVVERIEAYLAR